MKHIFALIHTALISGKDHAHGCLFAGSFFKEINTFSSCKDEEQDYSLCQQGTIIGKIRSGGGGPAVSVNSTVFGKHSWRGYNNVVEALNLKQNYASGTKIYFKARPDVLANIIRQFLRSQILFDERADRRTVMLINNPESIRITRRDFLKKR